MASASNTPKVIRFLGTVYLFFSLFVQWSLIFILEVIFIALTFPFTTHAWRQDMCGHIFRKVSFVGMDMLNPLWHVHVLNKFPQVQNKKVILVMNHLSSSDPFVAIRSMLPRDGSWICKNSLFRVPLGGWGLYLAGDLAVQFKNKKAGFETVKGTVGPMMEEARRKLQRGRMLCVFPEGIRNKDPNGGLGPFRLGFFSLAVDEGAVIVPLALSGTEKLWPRGSSVMDEADAYFSFGAPVEAKDFNNAEELSQHVWNVITDLREKHPDRVALRESQAAAASAS